VSLLAAFVIIFGGGVLCLFLPVDSTMIMIAALFVLFPIYCKLVNLPTVKKLFLVANASLLVAFCSFYVRFLTAPYELGIDDEPYRIRSSLYFFGICFIVILGFYTTLTRKIPYLLSVEQIDDVWTTLSVSTLVLFAMIIYMNPLKAEFVMAGRIREVVLVSMPVVLVALYFFYHYFWWSSSKIQEYATLAQENQMYMMERRRLEDLSSYIEDVRILRHDIRHHMLVIQSYAEKGQNEDILKYLDPVMSSIDRKLKQYSANAALDAVAAHFDAAAEEQETKINWELFLPDKLEFSETDLSTVFCNLLENALHAVAELPVEKRRIHVTSRMLSDKMLGISVENPYEGIIRFGTDGLPKTERRSHGIGMLSVASIVKRYNGTLGIKTDNGMFVVDILMMARK